MELRLPALTSLSQTVECREQRTHVLIDKERLVEADDRLDVGLRVSWKVMLDQEPTLKKV